MQGKRITHDQYKKLMKQKSKPLMPKSWDAVNIHKPLVDKKGNIVKDDNLTVLTIDKDALKLKESLLKFEVNKPSQVLIAKKVDVKTPSGKVSSAIRYSVDKSQDEDYKPKLETSLLDKDFSNDLTVKTHINKTLGRKDFAKKTFTIVLPSPKPTSNVIIRKKTVL